MSTVEVIVCPYDSGRRDWRCGLGPAQILKAFQASEKAGNGKELIVTDVEAHAVYPCEASLGFDAQRQISRCVSSARDAGRFPIVLGGNCNTAVGGASGVNHQPLGLIWFDAHSDFCTPETTETGFFDGMGLAMLVGRCWRGMLATVPTYQPIPENVTAHVGGRGLSRREALDLSESAIAQVGVDEIRTRGVEAAFDQFLTELGERVDQVYVHIDLDVLDPHEAPANFYNEPDGLAATEVRDAIRLIGERVRIAAAGIASYNPAFDPDGTTALVASGLIETLIASSTSSST